jgi:hypothetical protein
MLPKQFKELANAVGKTYRHNIKELTFLLAAISIAQKNRKFLSTYGSNNIRYMKQKLSIKLFAKVHQ